MLRKYFLAKFFVPLIIRNVSTNFKAGFGKLNFWLKIHSRDPCKNGENFVLSQNVLRKYFSATLFVPLIIRSVSTTFKAVYGKLNCWRKIHSRGPYKNGENFLLSQIMLRKYYLAKFFVPLIKRSVSTNFKAGFGKLNFWRKIHSCGPYKNGENFVLYSKKKLRKSQKTKQHKHTKANNDSFFIYLFRYMSSVEKNVYFSLLAPIPLLWHSVK